MRLFFRKGHLWDSVSIYRKLATVNSISTHFHRAVKAFLFPMDSIVLRSSLSWVFVWVYLPSPSCDNGSDRGVYGGNGSGGQQHRGSALWRDRTAHSSCLLDERWTASADRPTASDQQGWHPAAGQSAMTVGKTQVWKSNLLVVLWIIGNNTWMPCFSSLGSRFLIWLVIYV